MGGCLAGLAESGLDRSGHYLDLSQNQQLTQQTAGAWKRKTCGVCQAAATHTLGLALLQLRAFLLSFASHRASMGFSCKAVRRKA